MFADSDDTSNTLCTPDLSNHLPHPNEKTRSAHLMAANQGQLSWDGPIAVARVQVGVAHAAVLELDETLPRSEFGRLLDRVVADDLERGVGGLDDGRHLSLGDVELRGHIREESGVRVRVLGYEWAHERAPYISGGAGRHDPRWDAKRSAAYLEGHASTQGREGTELVSRNRPMGAIMARSWLVLGSRVQLEQGLDSARRVPCVHDRPPMESRLEQPGSGVHFRDCAALTARRRRRD